MSQAHKDFILAALVVGADPADVIGQWDTLTDWGIPEDQILALDPSYEFLPEDSYDPCCDIPDYAQSMGVNVNPVNRNQCCIKGNDSLYSFCFLLRGNVA